MKLIAIMLASLALMACSKEKQTPAVPAKEAPAVPAKEAPAVPAKEAPAVPAKEAPAVPAKETSKPATTEKKEDALIQGQTGSKTSLSAMPDCVFVYTGALPGMGAWFGSMTMTLSPTMRTEIPHDPKKQTIIIITQGSGAGLPGYLEANKAYYWKGGNTYTFIRNVNTIEERNKIIALLGEEGTVPNDMGAAPWK